MNCWVFCVKDTLIAFDAMPWVNYQGDLYMGQLGECYIVVTKLENVDKWGVMVKVDKVEEPSFVDSADMKLLNPIKVQLIKTDDPNIAVYVRESDEVKTCYFTKTLDLGIIHEEKLLYIYLEGTNTLKINPVFLDKFGVLYEPMEQRVVRSLSWQGLPIPKLAPKPTSSIGTGIFSPKGGDSRNVASMQKMPNLAEDALSSRATASVDRVMPKAPPMLEINAFSTLERGKTRPSAHEVHSKATDHTRPTPTARFSGLADDVSAFAPRREFKDNRRVRPANFQKWIKKFNGSSDPYDHLASFKQIA